MATSFDATPKWFDANFYMAAKLAKMNEAEPEGGWNPTTLQDAFTKAGFANPYDHYLAYGDMEGLTPNVSFNNAEYLADKAAMMGSTWTPEMVATAIKNAGLTYMQHYDQFGSAEGLSPSSAFNQDKYYEAKLEQLQTADPAKGWTLDTLKAAFAAAGLSPLEHYMLYAEVEGLDVHDYSDAGKPIPHPGNKIALTKDADIVTPDATVEGLKTSAKDDMISGVVSSKSTEVTFGANDVINGGNGTDTLTLDMKGDFSYKTGSTGTVENVENIVLNNGVAKGFSFDAKGVKDADVYTVNGGDKGDLTIKNVDSAETGYSLKQTAGTFKVQIVDSALTGKEDDVTVALNGVGVSGAGVTLDIGGTSATGKVEGLTLAAEGKDNFVTLKQAHTSVDVVGAGNVDVTVAGNLVDFDASVTTGDITANLGASLGTLKTITGGDGNDTFNVNGVLGRTTVVDGGAGDDTLKFGAFAGDTVIKSAISGVEIFDVTTVSGSNAYAVNFDLSKVEGLETIKIGGATDVAANGSYVVSKPSAYDTMNLQVANELTSVKGFSYDGAGVLNVSLAGDASGASATGTALTTLTAKNITDLTVTNNAETGALTITTLEASALTSLTINAGNGDSGGVTFTGTTNKLNNLETITITGEADVKFVHGATTSNLDTVDASGLSENLELDLSGAIVSEGVEITMGNGGATTASGMKGLTGTTKADTFVLGAGSETVNLKVSASLDAYDTLQNFSTDDIIALTTTTGTKVSSYSLLAKTSAAFVKAKIHGFESDGLDLYATADNGLVDNAIFGQFEAKGNASGATDKHAAVTVGSLWYFAIDNGSSIGIYQATAKTSVSASAAAGSTTFNVITLVGVLEGGITLDQLTDDMFV